MKKALAMALGGLMVAGTAAPAMAASSVDFSGYYKTYFMSDTNLGAQADPESFNDNYMGHRLNVDLTFSPTDEISVYWRLRAPDFQRWGTSTGDNESLTMETKFVYGKIKQDWGTVLVGRFDDALDVYGLASLGYQPGSEWNNVGPFDGMSNIDAVRFSNEWDNGFSLMAQYARTEAPNYGGMPGSGGTNVMNSETDWDSDVNSDRINLEATYKWDGGGVGLGVIYDRNASDLAVDNPESSWFVNPSVMHSFGAISVHFEGMAGWGEDSADGYGFYLDADYNYGPGNVTFAGWWNSGTSLTDEDRGDMVSIDQGNFYPLMVAYNTSSAGYGRVGTSSTTLEMGSGPSNAIELANNAGTLFLGNAKTANAMNTGAALPNPYVPGTNSNGIKYGISKNRVDQNDGSSNHWALALTGNHAFTDDISMNYAVAYLSLVEPTYSVVDSASYSVDAANYVENIKDQDEELGFELDLGFTFKLLDNLDFNTSFGYMFNGDAYKTLRGYNVHEANPGAPAAGDSVTAVWEDADDTYVWYNTLTFSF